MIKSSVFCLFLLLVVLMQEAAALYYKPRPLVCPSSPNVQYLQETLQAKEVKVVEVPLPVTQFNINTVYQTSVVPVTSVILHTVTAPAEQVEVTGVHLVEVTSSVTEDVVDTVTSTVVTTQLDVLTHSATNYHTEFHTLPVHETSHLTVESVETIVSQVTQTVPVNVLSTITITKMQLQTKVETKDVPMTSVVATSVVVVGDHVTNTHKLTKMITQTICPPANYHSY